MGDAECWMVKQFPPRRLRPPKGGLQSVLRGVYLRRNVEHLLAHTLTGAFACSPAEETGDSGAGDSTPRKRPRNVERVFVAIFHGVGPKMYRLGEMTKGRVLPAGTLGRL